MLPDKKNVVISNVMRELRDKNKEKYKWKKDKIENFITILLG